MFREYIEPIKEALETGEGLVRIITDIINENGMRREKILDNYGRYKQDVESVPIFDRSFHIDARNDINWKLANDWFSEIIDTKTGYMFGTPMVVQLESQAKDYQRTLEEIEKFKKRNNLDDLNADVCKFSGMAGYDALLLYLNEEGEESVKRIDPWEVIFISDGEISSPKYAIHYYKIFGDKWRVVFYDMEKERVFEGQETNPSSLVAMEEDEHIWGICPLFGVPNNSELMGDADKVLSLIDAYDRTVSDLGNEIEEFRLAYMIFIGYQVDSEQLALMKKDGALYIPTAMSGEGIHYLTKNIDITAVKEHLDRLEKDITRFAKHVNFTDESFGNNLSGVAMKYKLFALENKAKTFERKHEAAMMQMFKGLANAWDIKTIPLDYTMVDCKYTRNIAIDISAEATAAQSLMGVVSQRTILEQLSFVRDVEAEMDRLELEKEQVGSGLLDNYLPTNEDAAGNEDE